MIKLIKKIYGVLSPFLKKISYDNIYAISGQSAFFLLLSAVPLTMFCVSVLQNLHIPVDILEKVFGTVFNEEATATFSEYIGNFYKDSTGISIVTITVTLWSAAKGVHVVINGLNRVFSTYENRNWLLLRIRAMISTAILFGILFLSLAVLMMGSFINSWLSQYISYMPWIVSLLLNLRYIIIFIYMTFIFMLIFRTFPNLNRQQRKSYNLLSMLPGALFTSAAWFVLTIGISIYVTDFNGFSVYGGLIRIAVLMVWLYFCMVCLMAGAEINVVYHSRIRRIMLVIGNLRRNRKLKKLDKNNEKKNEKKNKRIKQR